MRGFPNEGARWFLLLKGSRNDLGSRRSRFQRRFQVKLWPLRIGFIVLPPMWIWIWRRSLPASSLPSFGRHSRSKLGLSGYSVQGIEACSHEISRELDGEDNKEERPITTIPIPAASKVKCVWMRAEYLWNGGAMSARLGDISDLPSVDISLDCRYK